MCRRKAKSGGVWWGRKGSGVFKVVEKRVERGNALRLQQEALCVIPTPPSKPVGGVLMDGWWADADRGGRRDEVGEIEGFPCHLRSPRQSVGGRPYSCRHQPPLGGRALLEAVAPKELQWLSARIVSEPPCSPGLQLP